MSATKLVIVESPAKAATIEGYLGPDYHVTASIGHIRDLPQPSELPKDMKKGPFGRFAVNVDEGFKPYYVVNPDRRKRSPSSRSSSRNPTNSSWQLMRTVRVRLSRGTSCRS